MKLFYTLNGLKASGKTFICGHIKITNGMKSPEQKHFYQTTRTMKIE